MPRRSQRPVPPRLRAACKREARQRPERQLNDIVIELHRRVLKVMQAVDDQHGDERAARSDQRPRGRIDQRKCSDHHDLGQRVIGGIHAEQPVHDFNEPPRQRRQLVGAEHPFAAVGQRLDQIERQVGVEERRQRGPDGKMERQKRAKRRVRAARDPADQALPWRCIGRRRRRGRCIGGLAHGQWTNGDGTNDDGTNVWG